MGGSSSTYLLDRVESKAFRLLDAPLLTSQLPSLKLRRDVASLSLFYRYIVRMSLTIVSLVLKAWVAILDLLLPRMNFVWRLASIDMVAASFHTQVTCGIFWLLQFSLPLTICLPLKVGCTSTSEMLIDQFPCSLCNIFWNFKLSHSFYSYLVFISRIKWLDLLIWTHMCPLSIHVD